MESALRNAALGAVLGLLCATWHPASAQVASATSAPPIAVSAPCCDAVADTLVELETTEAISSRDRKPGDSFGLRLHAPLIVDGSVVIPAGTMGIGQIVHAERARGGGKPGELILAARYLQLDDRQVRLHGMKLFAVGGDHSKTALAVAMAVGVFGQFVHGGEVEIPAGTLANAKLVEGFSTTTMAAPVAVGEAPPTVPTGAVTAPPDFQPTVRPQE
jgi:hypothetical protein